MYPHNHVAEAWTSNCTEVLYKWKHLGKRGSTGKRVGSKVNDKDANLASYWNIVGFRKTILCRDLKPVRAQIFISPAIY